MTSIRILIAGLALTALPLAALAEGSAKGNGRDTGERGNSAAARENGNGHRGGERPGSRRDGDLNPANGNSAAARANPSQGFCAPGLQRKETGCVPPGQAAAGVTPEEWAQQRGYDYVPGAQLEPTDYVLLPNYSDYGLPELAEGETYAVIGRTAVVIDPLTETLLRLASR